MLQFCYFIQKVTWWPEGASDSAHDMRHHLWAKYQVFKESPPYQAAARCGGHKPESHSAPQWLKDSITQVALHKPNKLSRLEKNLTECASTLLWSSWSRKNKSAAICISRYPNSDIGLEMKKVDWCISRGIMAVQHGDLRGRGPVLAVDINSSLLADENTTILIFRWLFIMNVITHCCHILNAYRSDTSDLKSVFVV